MYRLTTRAFTIEGETITKVCEEWARARTSFHDYADLVIISIEPVGWGDVNGSWPADCPQRAFVEGAKWWEYKATAATMWQNDRNLAEEEAEKRYGKVEVIDLSDGTWESVPTGAAREDLDRRS